jgi:hypothetical protein
VCPRGTYGDEAKPPVFSLLGPAALLFEQAVSIQDQQKQIPGAHSVKKAFAEFTKNSPN